VITSFRVEHTLSLPPRVAEPAQAGEAIRAAVLAGTGTRARASAAEPLHLTVADASARSGVPLRDADAGLTWLSTQYRGQLRVTADGDLVHVFPTGFTRPWKSADARRRVAAAIGRGAMGAVRFVVRAWVTIVLVAYAALFVALLIGLTFARQGNDSSSRSDRGLPGGALAYGLLRVLGDALFWTFHPWSPFAYGGMGWNYAPSPLPAASIGARAGARSRAADRSSRVPLYERVNRFFFGPPPAPPDPRADEKRIVEAIRAGKGRIGLADVMRVTGLPREEADPLMARLMLDYEGDVDVSEDGGIVYRFAALRRSASDEATRQPAAAWERTRPLPPLTGNGVGANLAIGGLNAFNLFMGLWGIANDMTLERAVHLFDKVPYHVVGTGTPLVFGVIPLVFSALLFLVPLGRALVRPSRARAAAEERGRLGMLREVLDRVGRKEPVTDAAVDAAWTKAAGEPAPRKRIDRELAALGGDVEIEPSGATRWRFADLETEAVAVEAEREAAAEDEAHLGEVVYATDKA